MLIHTGSAYLAEYANQDDELVAEYEFKYAGRIARDVNWYYDEIEKMELENPNITGVRRSNIEWGYTIRHQSRGFKIYVKRDFQEKEPPPEIKAILDKAVQWSRVEIVHPWRWDLKGEEWRKESKF